jgi:hypothetical protein
MKYASLTVAAMTIILAGCASDPKYQATVNDPKSEAVIVGSSQQGTIVTLHRIDGKKVGTGQWQRGVTFFGNEESILVDPGDRVLLVHCEADSLFVTREATAQFYATLKSAHIYQLRCVRYGNDYTFWLEDRTAHMVMGIRSVTDKSTLGQWVALPPLPIK